MEEKTTKVLVRFPEALLTKVEDYRHDNRIASRHQAILDLIEKGLKKEASE